MQKVILVLVAILAATAGVLIYQHKQQQLTPEYALFYQNGKAMLPFSLVDHHSKPFTNQSLIGNWYFVFLGYTSCPDICPTTLQQLNFIYPKLQKIAENSQILFVSVDPKRDTTEKLNKYIQYFNPKFIAATAGHEQLFPFARNLGLIYAITEQSSEAHYLVDHSAAIALINPHGQLAAIFKPELEPGKVPHVDSDKLISDFSRIVALYH